MYAIFVENTHVEKLARKLYKYNFLIKRKT